MDGLFLSMFLKISAKALGLGFSPRAGIAGLVLCDTDIDLDASKSLTGSVDVQSGDMGILNSASTMVVSSAAPLQLGYDF